MEQRYDAVLMVIRDGFQVSEVATKFHVSRQTLYKWMADYEAEGPEGLKDRSHRPHHVPHQLDGEREAAIIDFAWLIRSGDRCALPTNCVARDSRCRV
jgi:transposase